MHFDAVHIRVQCLCCDLLHGHDRSAALVVNSYLYFHSPIRMKGHDHICKFRICSFIAVSMGTAGHAYSVSIAFCILLVNMFSLFLPGKCLHAFSDTFL